MTEQAAFVEALDRHAILYSEQTIIGGSVLLCGPVGSEAKLWTARFNGGEFKDALVRPDFRSAGEFYAAPGAALNRIVEVVSTSRLT